MKHLRKYASGQYLLCTLSHCFRIFKVFLHVFSPPMRYCGPYKDNDDMTSVMKNLI